MKDLEAKIAALEELIEKTEDGIKEAQETIKKAKEEMRVYTNCLEAFKADKQEERELFNTLYAQAAAEGASESNFRDYANARGIELPNEEPETDQEVTQSSA